MKLLLIIVDGWGLSKTRDNNAIRLAKLKNFKKLVGEYPAMVLRSGSYQELGEFLSQILSKNNFSQLRIAESEKFVAITDYFNNSNKILPKEDRKIIASPVLSKRNYKMATKKIVSEIVKAIKANQHDFILSSWPNLEVAKESGNLKEVMLAVEFVDMQLGQLIKLAERKNFILAFTAVSPGAEEVFDIKTGLPINAKNNVPLILAGGFLTGKTFGLPEAPNNDLSLLESIGSLADGAATILSALDLEISSSVPGESLI
jgi:2,3-bisphosphoglycerate-independent phosphoglycerate mutase